MGRSWRLGVGVYRMGVRGEGVKGSKGSRSQG